MPIPQKLTNTKMKNKTLLFGLCALLWAGITHAQEPVRYGLKAGLNLSNYQANVSMFEVNTKTLPSFYVTAFADIPLQSALFYVQPGISFQGKGGKLTGSYSTGNNTYSATIEERPYWIEVPVNLIGKFELPADQAFYVGVGPYVGFGVGGNYRIRTQGAGLLDWIPTVRTDIRFGEDGHLKSVDAGLNFLAGFELANGLGIEAGYGLGLTDIGGRKISLLSSDLTKFDQQNRVFRVGLNVKF